MQITFDPHNEADRVLVEILLRQSKRLDRAAKPDFVDRRIGRRKLTMAQAREIRAAYAANGRMQDLATQYGVAQSTVQKIIDNHVYVERS